MKCIAKTTILQPAKLLAILLSVVLFSTASAQTKMPTPEEHFGFKPGTDKMLFNYESLIEYTMRLYRLSDKMYVEQIGESEMGKPIYAVFISSPANILRLSGLKQINRALALNPAIEDSKLDSLIAQGKAFVLFTLSMHSAEVGPSQAAPVIMHELLTANDERTRLILENTVCVLVPCHNPDGMNMIVEHYNRYKNTPLDGCLLPGLYHKYVGHNINRDFIALTQKENKAVANFYGREWFPQVMIEKHQMGSNGPRYYVSPPHDPIAENVDAAIWNWMRVFGSRTITDMTRAGLKGISVNYLFDDYWPGSTTTSIWKGIIGMLSEAAGVNLASPIYVEPGELRTIGKGLGEYAKSINMPDPWPGGWWRLGDIVEYERTNAMSYLYTAALHKNEILRFRNDHTRLEVRKGQNEAPYYYTVPTHQRDQSEVVALVNLLEEHGINTYSLNQSIQIEKRLFQQGDIVIPLAQPYRSFIKEIMEKQKFPVRRYTPEGEIIKPYDVTSWSLPLHKGVEAAEINTKVSGLENSLTRNAVPFTLQMPIPGQYNFMLFSAQNNESFKAAFLSLSKGMEVSRTTEPISRNDKTYPVGSFLIKRGKGSEDLVNQLDVSPAFLTESTPPPSEKLKLPRIALVESWFSAMDAGWARFLFDTYHLPYTVLRPKDLQETSLSDKFDVVILTDENKSVLMDGKYGSEGTFTVSRYPPEHTKGMEKKGLENLLQFINNGGLVLSWGRSVDLFTGMLSIGDGATKQEFQLPLRNIGNELLKKGLEVPGSALRMKLREDHPLTYGMPAEVAVFHRGSPVFSTSIPYFDMDRRVIASFPEDQILISGYALNESLLAQTAAMVWIRKGKGQLVVYGFSPHHRGQTPATYKLLWNAILLKPAI